MSKSDKPGVANDDNEIVRLRAMVENLEELLEVHERVVAEQSARRKSILQRHLSEKLQAQADFERAGRALRLSEERYRILFERSPLPIMLFDPDTLRVLEVNDTAVELYGYSQQEFLGKCMTDLAQPVAGAASSKSAGDVPYAGAGTDGSQPWRGIQKHRRKDGSVVDLEITAHVVVMGGHRVVLAIGNDVTERRRLQEHVQQAQKMEAIGSLAGGIAHDFNNLLSVIVGHSEMLTMDLRADDPMRVDLEAIKAAGNRATALTNQLLAFSRQQVLKPRVMSLHEIVSGMLPMLRRLIGADVDLELGETAASQRINADPSQIEQVIMNLVVNARDAMPLGGTITLETVDALLGEADAAACVGIKPGPHVGLIVRDTGSGIDKATEARIFEPFFTTKEVGKGTGLGLATVFGIVRQSGGGIAVDSEPGHGTTFRVYFPGFNRPLSLQAAPPSVEARNLRGSETILLVEDEESVRLLARSMLRKCGYNVLDAQTGGDALLLCEQHEAPIHLLLTDVVMPRMNGPQLAQRLLVVRPEMKVLYMSGYTDDAVLRPGIVDATIPFLQKPLTLDVLAHKVRDVLDTAKPAQGSLPAVR